MRQFGAKRESRGAVRRLIDLECGVYCDVWGDVIPHRVTDVSEDGLWIETELLLEVGTEVTLTFYPPDWDEPLCVTGHVRRVELERGPGRLTSIGMGIAFDALRNDERRQLRDSMRCLRADASYLLDQRTLVGVPVRPANEHTEEPEDAARESRRTVFGWSAPSEPPEGSGPEKQPEPSGSSGGAERSSSDPEPSRLDTPASAFGGGLDLAASVFGSRNDD